MVKPEVRVTRDLDLETCLLLNSRSSSDNSYHATDLSGHGDAMQSTSHDDENREYNEIHLSWRIVAAIGIASLTSALMGYDEGIMSGAVTTLQASLALTNFETDVMMGCLNFCSAFGTFGASCISDAYGRKSGLYATTILLIVGPLLMCSAYTYTQLMIGRITTGFGCGFAITVAPLYAAELAPATLRGSLVALAETSINFGVFMGYVVAYMLARLPDDYDWRLMVGGNLVVSVATLAMLPLVPETPRWLRLQNRLTAPAQSAGLQRVTTSAQGLVTQRSAYTDILAKGTAEGTWGDILFPTAQTKRMLAAGLGIAIYQQVCGSEAVVYYTPAILVEAGVGPSQSDDTVLLCTMAVGFTKFLFAGLGAYTVERTGRRACAILSCGGTAVCLLGLAVAKRCDRPNSAVALLCLFMMFFELGLGPLPAVLGSEIYPMAIRARALALGTFVNRIIASCSAGVFPSMLHTLGAPNTFLLFGLSGATGVLYCYGIVPETKGLTLEDVESLFQSRAMVDAKDCTHLASDADEWDGKLG